MLDNSHIKSPSNKLTFSQRLSQFEKEHGYTAYVYAIISNVCFVILQINMKIVCRYISPMHALSIRGFFLFLINSFVIHYGKVDINIK